MAGNPGSDVKGKLDCHYRCWLSMNVDQLATSQLCKFTIHPAHCGTLSFSKNHKVNFPKKSRLCWQPYNHHKSLQLNNGWRGEQTFIVRGTLRETIKAHRRTLGPPRRILSVRCSLFALFQRITHELSSWITAPQSNAMKSWSRDKSGKSPWKRKCDFF